LFHIGQQRIEELIRHSNEKNATGSDPTAFANKTAHIRPFENERLILDFEVSSFKP
jgi:hypothetical protein